MNVNVNLLWYFLFYSFLGFCLEVVYARCAGHVKQDRKCLLLLPLCPVYGLGAVWILSLPDYILSQPLLLLPAAGLTATAAEYLMSLFYEKLWRVSFWDYAGLPGNVHGRICLPFSLSWGVLSLLLVYLVQPAASSLVSALPQQLLLPLFSLFTADSLVTGHLLRQSRNTDSLKWYALPTEDLEVRNNE